MKRFSSATLPVLFSLFLLAAFARCIPSPDVSGLPPYDAGVYAYDSAIVIPSSDSGAVDATTPDAQVEAGNDATMPQEAGPQFGTVSGIVIDFTEGNGQGVVPGAVISLSYPTGVTAPGTLPAPVTSDTNGLFTIPNVPASSAPLQIGVTKPTDLTDYIAYSNAVIVTTVGAGQTVSVFPVLHEGCIQTTNVLNSVEDGGTTTVTLANGQCLGGRAGFFDRPGAYAALSFGPTSFVTSAGNIWSEGIRVEMIPLSYPLNANDETDFSWAIGLPGASVPPGLIGAAEYRVVISDPLEDGGVGADDGQLLAVNPAANASPVTIAVPVYTAPAGSLSSASYSISTATWGAELATPSAVVDDGGANQSPVAYVTIQVPHLDWWGVTNGPAASTCITGTVQGPAGPVGGALVRLAGTNYLGTSTTQSSSAGTFCLDLTAGVSDGASAIQLYAEALAGGFPYSATAPFTVTTAAGSCETGNGTGCMPVGVITLAPSLTCVSGTVQAGEQTEGNAVPSSMQVTVTNIAVTSSAQSVGIQDVAYIGEASIAADGGAFCAPAPPESEIELYDPTTGCAAPFDDAILVQSATGAVSCTSGDSDGGCRNAGVQEFACPLPP